MAVINDRHYFLLKNAKPNIYTSIISKNTNIDMLKILITIVKHQNKIVYICEKALFLC